MKVTRSDGPLVVAVDTSTTATKAVVVDPVGRVLATGRSDIPLHTHEPEVLAAADKVVGVHSYVTFRLTGEWLDSTATADSLGGVGP